MAWFIAMVAAAILLLRENRTLQQQMLVWVLFGASVVAARDALAAATAWPVFSASLCALVAMFCTSYAMDGLVWPVKERWKSRVGIGFAAFFQTLGIMLFLCVF